MLIDVGKSWIRLDFEPDEVKWLYEKVTSGGYPDADELFDDLLQGSTRLKETLMLAVRAMMAPEGGKS